MNYHYYSLTTEGLKHNISKSFYSRESANQYMYKKCGKLGIQMVDVYDDKHYKTYIYGEDRKIRFYIHRV